MRLIRALLVAATGLLWTTVCAAQSFNQVIVFGDSSVDSGSYKVLASPGGSPEINALFPAAVAAGAGVQTTSPGLGNAQYLASYFGLTATPANQPGGTNYATNGAKNVTVNTAATGGFTAATPTVTQIANYLAAKNGQANPSALYLISSGGNDIVYAIGSPGIPLPSDPTAYVVDAANSLAAAIGTLYAAGARYFIVPNQAYSFPPNNTPYRALKLAYSNALWAALTSAGIDFIPADFNALLVSIQSLPAAYGFITGSVPACVAPAGITSAYALLCSSNPTAPSTLVAPNAALTHLFADDQHFSTGGQKILGHYWYSLVVKKWGAAVTATAAPVNGAGYAEIAPAFNGTDGNLSYIRLSNGGPATTTYGVTVVGSPSGTVYGSTTFAVPTRASRQYPLTDILASAGAGALSGGDTSYSIYLRDADVGLSYQHVIYNEGNGFFENLSACKYAAGGDYTEFNYKLVNVHTSQIASYPAQISIHNYSTSAATYNVSVFDAATGSLVGTVPIQVAANSTYYQPFARFEQLLNWTPTASQLHANMVFQTVSPGIYDPEVGVNIVNGRLSATVSMTQRCGM